ncbi:hypothetical protein HCA58_15000 [Micromonospora sp. HNM0581]|uniref:hypothetical protein n=1 Tax=Micromonospora sp. HNM0581 TaxID=2716341 RepID=UPI00146E1C37|nr:hypothetical protein [Micromonospora sp. HNM0581]NLU79668.1 hypothetical protein [Micromonospora sp. HNM0581]
MADVADESRTAPDTGADESEIGVLDDPERAIKREIEVIAERFPRTDVSVVAAAVRETVAELRAEAQVETHVMALARHRVYDRLCAQGHEFEPGTDTAAEPPDGPEAEALDRADQTVVGDARRGSPADAAVTSQPD